MSIWSNPGRFRSSNQQQDPKLEELLPIVKFKNGQFYTYRPLAPPITYAEHWFKLLSRDGNPYSRRKLCLGYDHESGEIKWACPYCELGVAPKVCTLMNVIDRREQELMPARQPNWLPHESKEVDFGGDDGRTWFPKDKDSNSWTPVVPIRLPGGACQALGNYAQTNTRRSRSTGMEQAFGPEDVRFGFDFKLKFDKNQKPQPYFIQKTENTALTEEELDYLVYNLAVEQPDDPDKAARDANYFSDKMVADDKDNSGNTNAGGGRAGRTQGALDELDETAAEEAEDFVPDDTPTPRARGGQRAAGAAARAPARAPAGRPAARAAAPASDDEDPFAV